MVSKKIELPLNDYYPFEDKYLQINGMQIHYIEEGSAANPTILFFHGNPTWSFLYRKVIAELKADFHCLAFDYPGFGLSDKLENFDYLPRTQAQIASQFISKLDLDKFSLFVHDWGGPIGLAAAGGKKSQLIDKLIITNTWIWPVEKKRLRLFSRLLGSKLGEKFIVNHHGFVNYIMPWGITVNRRRFKRKILPFYQISSPQASYVFPREIRNSRRFLKEVEVKLSKLSSKPTLLLWGKWDPMFGRREINKLRQTLAPEEIVKLSAGHYLMEDKPKQISREVKKFLS